MAEQASGARNPISILGVWLTTLAAFAFIAFYSVDAFGLLAASPYAGIFGFLCLPAVFVLALLLIPIGIWREDRRRRRGLEALGKRSGTHPVFSRDRVRGSSPERTGRGIRETGCRRRSIIERHSIKNRTILRYGFNTATL